MQSATNQAVYREIESKLGNREWRLDNLYFIKDEQGRKIKFRRNWAQKNFYESIWYFNTILKARQLGFSTFILIYMLDACLFNDNHSAGVIAQSLTDATDLFENKIKFAYDNLPEEIRIMVPAVQDSARKYAFGNGSSITVGTSLRGGTYQKLHVSEYGKISAKYPEKAKEIKTGSFNTVHAGQQIFVESTAEGQGGEFFDLCERAKKLKEMNSGLTVLDPKLHFYSWFENPNYTLTPEDTLKVHITKEDQDYFRSLEDKGIKLTQGQKAWYVKKAEQQGEDMKREFPSTPEEAFETAVEGAYYSRQLGLIRRRGQVAKVPFDPRYPVHTFWDLGRNDMNTIWFMQHVGKEYRFINYYENHGEAIQHYANHLKELHDKLGYVYGEHWWPHDGNHKSLHHEDSLDTIAKNHGIKPLNIVPRAIDHQALKKDIQICRDIIPLCHFDIESCAKGLSHLGNYRKEWDEQLAIWKDKPRHDEASHGADGFRTFAVGYKPIITEKKYEPEEPQDPMDF